MYVYALLICIFVQLSLRPGQNALIWHYNLRLGLAQTQLESGIKRLSI